MIRYAIAALLTVALLSLGGCLRMMGKTQYATYDNIQTGSQGQTLSVAKGGVLLDAFKGVRKRILVVTNDVYAEWGGVDMRWPAASYGSCDACLEEDENYYYLYYPENNSVLTPNTMFGSPLRAGYRVAKADHGEVKTFAYSDFGDGIWEYKIPPRAKFTYWVDTDREYQYKRIAFSWFQNDILCLKLTEETGPSRGVGTLEGALVLHFDLRESRTITMGGAVFDVVDVSPDSLVVNVKRGLYL